MRIIQCSRVLLAALLLPAFAGATVYQGNPGNYRSLLDQLAPGDTLQLAAGTYTNQLQISDLHGTAGAPIVITGPQSGAAAIFKADNCCNTVQFDDVSYVEVSHLTLDGAGTDGTFAVDSRSVTHHITVSDLLIINYGADQQMNGISTKGSAWNWIVRRNRIIGAGTGMYFGSSDGSYPFVGGLIEYNVVLDTLGYNLQVKHQNPRPTNLGIPTGVNRTIIRHNVFSKANNASGGGLARPNVLVGHLPLSGAGQDDVYEIYGNFFYENPSEALFQGEGNIGLYGNLFVNSVGDAINIVPHNAVPRAVTVFQNTVVAAGRGIYLSGGSGSFTQRIIGNAVFASPAIQGPNQSANITNNHGSAHLYVKEPFGAIGQLDLYPLTGTLTGSPMDTGNFTGYTQWNLDFNGNSRDQAYRGAYSGAGDNPGWQLALAMKDSAAAAPPSPPTVSLSASPTSVTSGNGSTLSWSSSNATQCTASGAWSGVKATSGSQSTGALSASSSFTLTCTGDGGSAAQTVNVTVTAAPPPPAPAPQVSFSAAPAAIASGGSSTLTWSSVNATQCTASGAWSGARAVSGSQGTGSLSANSSYTLACTGAGGTTSRTVTVTVSASGGGSGDGSGGSEPLPAAPAQSSGGGGGGSMDWAWLGLLLGAGLRRHRRPAR